MDVSVIFWTIRDVFLPSFRGFTGSRSSTDWSSGDATIVERDATPRDSSSRSSFVVTRASAGRFVERVVARDYGLTDRTDSK